MQVAGAVALLAGHPPRYLGQSLGGTAIGTGPMIPSVRAGSLPDAPLPSTTCHHLRAILHSSTVRCECSITISKSFGLHRCLLFTTFLRPTSLPTNPASSSHRFPDPPGPVPLTTTVHWCPLGYQVLTLCHIVVAFYLTRTPFSLQIECGKRVPKQERRDCLLQWWSLSFCPGCAGILCILTKYGKVIRTHNSKVSQPVRQLGKKLAMCSPQCELKDLGGVGQKTHRCN